MTDRLDSELDKIMERTFRYNQDRTGMAMGGLTDAKAAILKLWEAEVAKAKIEALQSLNRDIFGDLVTAQQIKKTISIHLATLQTNLAEGACEHGCYYVCKICGEVQSAPTKPAEDK